MHLQIRAGGPLDRFFIDHDTQRAAISWREQDDGEKCCRVHDLAGVIPPHVFGYPMGGEVEARSMQHGVLIAHAGRTERDEEDVRRFIPIALHVYENTHGRLLWQRPLPPPHSVLPPLVQIAGDALRLVLDGKIAAHLRLRTGEPLMPDDAADFDVRWKRTEHRDTKIFTEMGGILEGSAEFAVWAAKIHAATGMKPVMKLKAMRHAGLEIVNFHADREHDHREHLLVLEHGRVLWRHESAVMRGRASHLVSHDWNLTDFYVDGEWLVFQTDDRTMQLLHLTLPPLSASGTRRVSDEPELARMLRPDFQHARLRYLPVRWNLSGTAFMSAALGLLFAIVAVFALSVPFIQWRAGRSFDGEGALVLLMMLIFTGLPWAVMRGYHRRMSRLQQDIDAGRARRGVFLRPEAIALVEHADRAQILLRRDITGIQRLVSRRPYGPFLLLTARPPQGGTRRLILRPQFGPACDDMDAFEKIIRDWWREGAE